MVCTPAGLTFLTRDANGRLTRAFTAVEPAVPARMERGTVGVLADDYDSWCENGSICTRNVTLFISETKGNAAYGDLTGVIGTFDVVLRTNLNGRQGQWKLLSSGTVAPL
jgi:hypothetical protein